jgi:lipoate-protein ligase A
MGELDTTTAEQAGARVPLVWRLVETDPPSRSGAFNMGLDAALLESVERGGLPALRFYAWDPPCLSFGRNQPVRGRFDATTIRASGIGLVRRPTGGGAVLHDRELTYAAVLPVGALGSPRAAHEAINRALVTGLRLLRVPAELSPRRRTATAAAGAGGGVRRDPDICFQAASPGEVVIDGRKLIGSAQRCRQRNILQHGSLLLGGDQSEIAEFARVGEPLVQPQPYGPTPITLKSLIDPVPAWSELVRALAAGFEQALGIQFARSRPTAGENRRAAELAESFASEDWIWRV